jgi:hypothetical protein
MQKLLLCLFTFYANQLMAQKTDTVFLQKLMKDNPALFSGILNHPTKNEVQIIYTQVNRDKNNIPSFKTFTYNIDPKHYSIPQVR